MELTVETLPQFIELLSDTPSRLTTLIENLSETELRLKPSVEEFSIVENICHLRDIEVEGYKVRIQRILNETRPFLPDLDGSRLAIERNYAVQAPRPALEIFRGARLDNIRVLRAIGEEELSREGVLEGVGTISLRKLLLLMQAHDESHLEEVGVLKRHLALRATSAAS